jgi:predicted AlkP superfamily phosphohydrolase/phosphomutase
MLRSPRILIIGLDGFTWRLGREFMECGVMPNLAQMVKQGCSGDLRSVIPFETPSAWASFQTGCYPAKTGVYTFHVYDRQLRQIHTSNFSDIAVPTLLELAHRAGKKMVSINLPMTWPAPKIGGIIIPGFMCPAITRDTVYPGEIYDRYLSKRHNYDMVNTKSCKTITAFVDQQIATEKARCDVALDLMRETPWDIFCVHNQSSDHVQHAMWTHLDSSVPGFRQDAHDDILRFYRRCDDMIGQITQAAGPETITFIISDHGFRLRKSSFWLNAWFREQGYLRLYERQIRKNRWTSLKTNLKKFVPGLQAAARLCGSWQSRWHKTNFLENDLSYFRDVIDLSNTSAMAFGAMAGLVYLHGNSGQRESLAREITRKLMSEFGEGSPRPVIRKITLGNETFAQNPGKDVPDLVVHSIPGVTFHVNPLAPNILADVNTRQSDNMNVGTHDQQGIAVLCGPGIKKGIRWDGDIVDIVPTILAILELPVLRHMDGRVWLQAFMDPPPIRYEDFSVVRKTAESYMRSEQDDIEKRLKDLGYL